MKYIYIDREEAKKGVSLVLSVSDKKIEDYKTYFEGQAIEYVGKDLPHFITYDESSDSVREATEFDLIKSGRRVLEPNEVVINDEVVFIDQETQKVVGDKIVQKTREDLISEGVITLETEKSKARDQRSQEYNAYQKLMGDLLLEIEVLTEEEKNDIRVWHKAWKDVPNNYTNIHISITNIYPNRPKKVDYYM